MADRLTDDWPKHWTGAVNAMAGLIRVDGKTYRWMGPQPSEVPALTQKELEVTATRSIYTFADAGIELEAEFASPLLMDDLDLLSRPATYLTLRLKSTDGRPHRAFLYFDATAEWCVDRANQAVTWSRGRLEGWTVQSFASKDQPVLGRSGDNLRIEWGRFFVLGEPGADSTVGNANETRALFAKEGVLPASDDFRQPRPAGDAWPAASFVFPEFEVGSAPAEKRLVLAYDEQLSIEYFRRKLPPYWRRKGMEAAEMLQAATMEREEVLTKCRTFDADLQARLEKAGGKGFASLAVLAYRQSIAGHQLVEDLDGDLLMFSKENFSNGCIATVDVTYPGAPMYLALAPRLAEAQVRPVLEYAASSRWPWPFAPHDLGTYPLANGQVYGGGERTEEDQMPVEECGNMLILLGALEHAGAGKEMIRQYAPVLKKWADYLVAHGEDPGEQLCTDDFAGHLAHNVNLSAKAIVGVAAYAKRLGGEAKYLDWAKKAAHSWVQRANDGGHFRLAFDRAGTWSQKYNLVWDRVLDLGLFPAEVIEKEVPSYAARLTPFGLALDNRADYTKLDWCVWTACLSGKRSDFDAHVNPLVNWVNKTSTRVPLTDWFSTKDGKQSGFQARTVVGGIFLPLLAPPK